MAERRCLFATRRFMPRSWETDDLGLPEIVEDICNGYRTKFGESIHSEIRSALKPHIVKFESANRTELKLLTPALLYCSYTLRKQELSLDSNTCYDGDGKAVRLEAI